MDALRFVKIQANKAQDAQGFTNALEDSLGDYQAMMLLMGDRMRVTGEKRLCDGRDLVVKGQSAANAPGRRRRNSRGTEGMTLTQGAAILFGLMAAALLLNYLLGRVSGSTDTRSLWGRREVFSDEDPAQFEAVLAQSLIAGLILAATAIYLALQ